GFCRCISRHSRFDEPMWREPDLTKPAFDGRTQIAFRFCRNGILANHVPCTGSTQRPDLLQLAHDRLKTAAQRRILNLGAGPIVPNGRRRVVDRYGVAGHAESRPRGVSVVGLAKHEIKAPGRKTRWIASLWHRAPRQRRREPLWRSAHAP